MRALEVPCGEISAVIVDYSDNGRAPASGREVFLSWSDATESVVMTDGDHVWDVSAGSGTGGDRFAALADDRSLLASVVSVGPHRATLEIRKFDGLVSLREPHRLVVADDVLGRFARQYGHDGDLGPVSAAFLMAPSGLRASPYRDDSRLVAQFWSDSAGSVRIFGLWGALDVARHGTTLVANRYVHGARPGPGVLLLHGDVEYTKEQPLESDVAGSLDLIVQTASDYLDLWRRYNEIEVGLSSDVRLRVGTFDYDSLSRSGGGLSVTVHGDQLNDRVGELVRRQMRVILTDSAWSPAAAPDRRRAVFDDEPSGVLAQAIAFHRDTQLLELAFVDDRERFGSETALTGLLVPTMRGEKTLLERREKAHERIVQGRAAMPGVADVIARGAAHVGRPRKGRSSASSVLARHFPTGATRRQSLAVEAAADTPDVMLIQGPPGTGKTQVISAIVDLLNEQLHDIDPRRRILVCSEQNETVSLLANRIERSLGLPPVSISGASSLAWERHRWALERAAEVRRDWSDRASEGLRDHLALRRLLQSVECTELRALGARAVLRSVLQREDQVLVPASLRFSASELLDQVDRYAQKVSLSERSRTLRSIRRLPSTPHSVADGGWILVHRALRDGAGILTDEEQQGLGAIDERACADPVRVANQLRVLRASIIRRLTRNTQTGRDRDWRPEVVPVLSEVVHRSLGAVGPEDAVVQVALEFAETLTSDPEGAVAALDEYSGVTASTNQRAGSDILARKAMRAVDDDVSFDTVIIDEAARANPLDLMIPMSLARRRIILVGDHRQLPQLLEPEVESALRGSVEEDTRAQIEQSLFERMFDLVRRADATRGSRRTVTLDSQFRMHPALGQFVGDTFYGDIGGLRSPTAAEQFTHDDPGLSLTPFAWIDVPSAMGSETGSSSRTRAAEALATAGVVQRWLSECDPTRTFGVMSLYRGQVGAILNELQRCGVAAQGDDGRPEILPTHRERLRVGTVDAFQGREFDHVVLSLVRTNENDSPSRRFGFLTLRNRLCVALSRQRRLLVVVGDHSFFMDEKAVLHVPELHAFARLCEVSDVVVRK